jgi:uncharacterized protein YecE (DUF72 family)
MSANLYLGCPVWAYKGWVGSFYPPGTKTSEMLPEYARRLNAVEGNTTFYATPSAASLHNWAAATPESFRFCPKLPRLVSHTGRLAERIEAARQFLESMRALGPRLGPMFLQLPPRYPPRLFDDLKAFLAAWPGDAALAVEVRHLGWFEAPQRQALNELLASRDMGRVVIDTRPIRSLEGDPILAGTVYQRMLAARQRKPDVPVFPERTAGFVFLRYIGHPQMEQNIPFIAEWSSYLAEWLAGGAQAYVFCHCPQEELDPWLCRLFYEAVADQFPLPPLPWDAVDAGAASQPRLF